MTIHPAFPAEFEGFQASDGSRTPPVPAQVRAGFDGETSSSLSRVLVVDDEHLIADTVAQILNFHGYDAFTAYSGAEALRLAERFRPDYLLTDVMMPVMNGIELARAIEEMLPAVKVLLFSGQAGTQTLLKRKRADHSDFSIVAKPIHPEKLVDALRNLQARRRN